MVVANTDVVDMVLCHLEAAFHATLHVRGVYPPELFELRRVLNMPVRISRHPALKAYVRDAVVSIREAMQLAAVDKVELVLLAKGVEPGAEPSPVERHVFDFGAALAHAGEQASDDDLEAIERNLRASLSSVAQLEHRLPALASETTFAIVVHTPESNDLSQNDDLTVSAKWLPESSPSSASHYRETYAVKSFSCSTFRLSHYVVSIERK
ncbi:hypothetical protein KFE25_008967 [Diacronema lutheri]|uniref:HORMA domain-containing protein n=1 Tax=Diacronema lutheri TaxID=2081491 RepID=A0A8J5XJT2_DIALT|nr:hypothetical protein KFE25_008967 [Diacronema lutheri]